MESKSLQHHQIIDAYLTQQTENAMEGAILLWEQLANKLITIIGEEGFNSLYARSILLAQPILPWLAVSARSPPFHLVMDLKAAFADQTPVDINAVNRLILITFTDILASLIGAELTANILRAAWEKDVSQRANQESKNE